MSKKKDVTIKALPDGVDEELQKHIDNWTQDLDATLEVCLDRCEQVLTYVRAQAIFLRNDIKLRDQIDHDGDER